MTSSQVPSSVQEAKWSGSSGSPAYPGELSRVPGVHVQEDHPLRRLLPDSKRPHAPGPQVQGAVNIFNSLKKLAHVKIISALPNECPPGLSREGALTKRIAANFSSFTRMTMMRNFVICVNTLQPNFVIPNINCKTHMDNIQKLYFHLRLPDQ